MGAHLVSLQHHKARTLSILLRNLLGLHSLGELHGRKVASQADVLMMTTPPDIGMCMHHTSHHLHF